MSKTVNSVLTITIILCMAILLLYGYCAIQKLDEAKEDAVVSTIGKHINYKGEVPNETDANIEDDTTTDEDDGDFVEYIEEDDEPIEEAPIEEEIPVIVEEIEAPKSPAPINKPDAAFLVIAGSFKGLSNAKTKVNQLKDMGVSAEIVHLHNSKLHAICIAKADTEKEATDTMKTLKANHNIKAYVYKTP